MKRYTLTFLLMAIVLLGLGDFKAHALPGGMLNGKMMILSKDGTSSFLDAPQATDNDMSTYTYVSYSGGARNTLSYTVPSGTFKITAYQVNYSNSGEFDTTFYNSSGGVIYRNGSPSNGANRAINLENVAKIEIRNRSGNPLYVHEFDVWGETAAAKPTNVKLTPDVRKITATFTGVAGATGYGVYLNDQKVGTTTSTSYEFTNLDPGKSYKVQFTAMYSGGGESTLTDPVSAEPLNDIVKPVVTGTPSWDKINLTWTMPNGATRAVLYKGDGTKIFDTTGSSYTATGLQEETTYTYYVVITDKWGRTAQSDKVELTTIKKPPDTDPPKTPAGLTAKMADDMSAIVLNWVPNNDDDLAGYNLFASIDGGESKKLNQGLLTSVGYSVKEPKPKSKYNFELVAVDTSGNASLPALASITVPSRNTDSEQQETLDYLLVTWTKTEGAVGYEIYLNGRKVGSVGPDVFSFKITREMGYIPGALINKTEVKALYADGSTGDGSSGGGSGGGGGVGGGGPLDDALSFIGVGDMIQVSIDFLSIYKLWIILILAVIFSPVLYGLIVKIVNYVGRRNQVKPAKNVLYDGKRR